MDAGARFDDGLLLGRRRRARSTASDWIAVGLAGTAASHDGGKTWTSLGEQPFNAVAFVDAHTGWAVGPKGTIVKFAKPYLRGRLRRLRRDHQVRAAEDLQHRSR